MVIPNNLSEKGAQLCRRPAAARREHSTAPHFGDLLRLVEDDTAALRDFNRLVESVFIHFVICALVSNTASRRIAGRAMDLVNRSRTAASFCRVKLWMRL